MRLAFLRRIVVVPRRAMASSRDGVPKDGRSPLSAESDKDAWDDPELEPVVEASQDESVNGVEQSERSTGLKALDKLIQDLEKRGLENRLHPAPREKEEWDEGWGGKDRDGGVGGDLFEWRDRSRQRRMGRGTGMGAPRSLRGEEEEEDGREAWAPERDERPPVQVGRSHRLSIEALPEETTEEDLEAVVEDIALIRPMSIEFFYGRANRVKNALVELETREVLERVLTPTRQQFGVYVRAQRCPIHDAMTRVTQLFVARLPRMASQREIEE